MYKRYSEDSDYGDKGVETKVPTCSCGSISVRIWADCPLKFSKNLIKIYNIMSTENDNKKNGNLSISDVIKLLPDKEYIITMEDSEEQHFSNVDNIDVAKKIYKNYSNGKSVMNKNARIYVVIDITDEIKGNIL